MRKDALASFFVPKIIVERLFLFTKNQKRGFSVLQTAQIMVL